MVNYNIENAFLGVVLLLIRSYYGDMLVEEFNILNHELVPEHIILKEGERKEILEKYKINPMNLPRILINDPVVKALKAKEGDVLKIVRKSRTAGSSVYFRVVVKK
jgi:DNA-directed RNA polymerase subunit H